MTGMEPAVYWAIASVAITTYSTVQQGKQADKEAKRQAQAAELDATAREIERTKRMTAWMAEQNVLAGAGGVGVSGSLANLQSVAVKENKLGLSSDRVAAASERQGLLAAGKNAKRAGLIGAAATAAGGASTAMQIGTTPKAKLGSHAQGVMDRESAGY